MARRRHGAGKGIAIFLVVILIIGGGLYGAYRYFAGDELLFDLISAFQKDVKADSLSFTMTYLDDFTVDGRIRLSEKSEELIIDVGGLDKLFNSRVAIRENQIYLDTLLGSFGVDASETTSAIASAIAAVRGSEVGDGKTPDYSEALDNIPFFGELIKEKREESEAEKTAKFDSIKYDECTKKLLLNLNRKSYVETFCDSVTITKSDDGSSTFYRYVINKPKLELAIVKAYKDAYLDAAVYEAEYAAAEAKLTQSSIDTLSYTITDGYLTSVKATLSEAESENKTIDLTVTDFNNVQFEDTDDAA